MVVYRKVAKLSFIFTFYQGSFVIIAIFLQTSISFSLLFLSFYKIILQTDFIQIKQKSRVQLLRCIIQIYTNNKICTIKLLNLHMYTKCAR